MSFSHTPDLIKVEIIKKKMIDTKYDTKYNGGEKMSFWDKLLNWIMIFVLKRSLK